MEFILSRLCRLDLDRQADGFGEGFDGRGALDVDLEGASDAVPRAILEVAIDDGPKPKLGVTPDQLAALTRV
jgi:hypothetical protein